MKLATRCLAVVVAACGVLGAAAQGKPNLSGTWTAVTSQQDTRELIIKLDGSTLSVAGHPDFRRHTFKLDGSETKMTAPDGKPLLGKAVWEGNRLVLTVHLPETKQDIRRVTWAVNADGELVSTTELLGGKPQQPRKDIFKRR
jgi:hypothetical protein